MNKALGAVFAAALMLIPALGAARTYSGDALFVSCIPAYPVVSAGNAGRFTVASNVQGPFQWVADDYSVIDAGAMFVTPFERPGPAQVDVVYGSIRSTCYVDVVLAPGYGEPYAASPFGGQAYGSGPNVTLSSIVYPRLPNTGFEPQTFGTFALAFALLLGAAIALYPHAKKAFIIVTR